MPGRNLVILLIDDDQNDLYFFQLATRKAGAGHVVHAVDNANTAIQYLRRLGRYQDSSKFPLPSLVILDLKMPCVNGFDFLRWLRKNSTCALIPVVVLSSSALEADVREAYALGANSFLTKPNTPADLQELLSGLYGFWSQCRFPTTAGEC